MPSKNKGSVMDPNVQNQVIAMQRSFLKHIEKSQAAELAELRRRLDALELDALNNKKKDSPKSKRLAIFYDVTSSMVNYFDSSVKTEVEALQPLVFQWVTLAQGSGYTAEQYLLGEGTLLLEDAIQDSYQYGAFRSHTNMDTLYLDRVFSGYDKVFVVTDQGGKADLTKVIGRVPNIVRLMVLDMDTLQDIGDRYRGKP